MTTSSSEEYQAHVKSLHPNSPWLLFRRDQDPKLKIEKLQTLGEVLQDGASTSEDKEPSHLSPSTSESPNGTTQIVDLSPNVDVDNATDSDYEPTFSSNQIIDCSKRPDVSSVIASSPFHSQFPSANNFNALRHQSQQPITDTVQSANEMAAALTNRNLQTANQMTDLLPNSNLSVLSQIGTFNPDPFNISTVLNMANLSRNGALRPPSMETEI